MHFVTELATARQQATTTGHELSKALKHVEPITAELHELFLQKPERYATCLRQMADILETLPTLRTAAKEALDTLSDLEKKACDRCNGTGRYWGPTNATRHGVPYCFRCDGNGTTTK